MLSKINYSKLVALITDDTILKRFEHFNNKFDTLQFLSYNNEAIFAFVKNKNAVYEGMTYFFETENTNEIVKSLQLHFRANTILYIMNKKRQDVFDNIDDSLINLKLHKYLLNTVLTKITNNYIIEDSLIDEPLQNFFINCFKDEFDENAKIWIKDFESYDLKKEINQIKINGKISAAIMYWVQDDSIFIFLLGTDPKQRRKNLASILIQKIQIDYPDKEISLTAWSGGKTEQFYLKIGFEKKELAHVCI